MGQININFYVDTTGLSIATKQIVSYATPAFIKAAVKEVGGQFVQNVYNPRIMPIDLGRARAGGRAGFIVTGKQFSPVGYSVGVTEGTAMSGAHLSATEFESVNKVPYAGELDMSHKGRRSAKRYNPQRYVNATGPYNNFVVTGQKLTVTRMGKILPPLMNHYFRGVPYVTWISAKGVVI